MRFMLTGAAGQLGSTIVRRFSDDEVVAFTRQQLDITNEPATLRAATTARPDVVINCAAFNDVDGAEQQAQAALEVNAFGVLSLARAARAVDAVFVHYSTDFVFDGEADRPYTETDATAPASTYGASKLLGEWFAGDGQRVYVLRVESLFGGSPAKSSVDKILKAIQRREPARVFVDRTVTPSYVEDVAGATASLIAASAPFGLYHCVNSGMTTWLGVGEEISRLLGVQAQLIPIRVDDVQLLARRPKYCALSNEKLRMLGIVMPAWQDALARHVSRLLAQGFGL
jgi:dTDP-4-dehydrorhamnose reductase